jgi:RNA polymerase sigma-70 factor (ECF subfamily)
VETEFGELIAAARSGERSAFEALYRRFHPDLIRFLRARVGGAAEDVASETWLGVARGLNGFRGDEGGFRGWLFTIARRRVVDHRRTQSRRPLELSASGELDDTDGVVVALHPAASGGATVDPSSSVERSGDAVDLLAALAATLPGDQAEVVILRVIVGYSVEEVAALLGRRPGTVRVLQHRALRRLAALAPDRVRVDKTGSKGVTQPNASAMESSDGA